jgi:hypothetical protein
LDVEEEDELLLRFWLVNTAPLPFLGSLFLAFEAAFPKVLTLKPPFVVIWPFFLAIAGVEHSEGFSSMIRILVGLSQYSEFMSSFLFLIRSSGFIDLL